MAHELSHFTNGHLFFEFAFQLFLCIFWWNPILRLLQNDFTQLLEIQCDTTVTKHLHAEDTLAYMSTIVHVIKDTTISECKNTFSKSSLFLTESICDRSEKERFHILHLQYKINKTIPTILIITLITAVLFLLSYTVIPIPSYASPIGDIEQDGALYIDPEKSWIFKKGDLYFLVLDEEIIPITDFEAGYLRKEGFEFRKELN